MGSCCLLGWLDCKMSDGLLERCLEESEVIIDFSLPRGTMGHLKRVGAFMKKRALALKGKKVEEKFLGYVIGTTGFSEEEEKEIEKLGEWIPILKSGNFSIGIHALGEVVKRLAGELSDWDLEIVESHHNEKVDAPSKTALMLYEACKQGRNSVKLDLVSKRTEKNQKRKKNEVGLFFT